MPGNDKFSPRDWDRHGGSYRVCEEVGRYWRRVEEEVFAEYYHGKRQGALEELLASNQHVFHKGNLKKAVEERLRNKGLLEENANYRAFGGALKGFCQIGLVRRIPKLKRPETDHVNFLIPAMAEWFRRQGTLKRGEPFPGSYPEGAAACIVHYITQECPDWTQSVDEMVANEADLYAKVQQYANVRQPTVHIEMGSLEMVKNDPMAEKILNDLEVETPQDSRDDDERVHNYTIAGEVHGASLELRPAFQLELEGVDNLDDVKDRLEKEVWFWTLETTSGVRSLYHSQPVTINQMEQKVDKMAEEVADLWNKRKHKPGILSGTKRNEFEFDVQPHTEDPERIVFASYVREKLERA